ncbi:uncharacterized protein LOC122856686 isoform X3 [Aphidius gifuensis]|uniref:uncharacterized protein LOC122856686 isoform X3 n=1 Tax=Aphidius gifuensis TaxID=684658 RepID=UPI001CDB5768|nr:uncharacterized protein LOC122856686 isoform X3 [Aphidius gifuensis]
MSKKPDQFGGDTSASSINEIIEKPSVPLPENLSDVPENLPDVPEKITKNFNNNSEIPGIIKKFNNDTFVEPSSSTNGYPEKSPMPSPKDETSSDGLKEIFSAVKSLDANRYATKKTIAQGMLDIALLTANASQLKYILQVGRQHEFYTLMLTLICLSIGLQIIQGIICLLLGSTYNINKEKDQKNANTWNNIVLAMMVLTVAINILISAFEMKDSYHIQEVPMHSGYYPY